MKKFVLMFGAGLLMVTAMAAQDGEKKITRSDLPPAVQKTVDAQSQGAIIRGYSKEVENGKAMYEAELRVNGRSKDISIDRNGKVVEIEEEVPFDSLSEGVQRGLKAKAGKGKLGKVESLTKRGKLVAYEAQVVTGKRKSEVQVGPEGKPLAHEE
jgi:hypothetical protein